MKLHHFAVAESLTHMTRNANQTRGPKLTILIFMREGENLAKDHMQKSSKLARILLCLCSLLSSAATKAQGTWPYIAPADLFSNKIVLFCKVNIHQMLMKIHTNNYDKHTI